VADYAERRFNGHCEDAERLVAALAAPEGGALEAARASLPALRERDDVFPEVLQAVSHALDGSRRVSRA
jgi:hypothetical protein